MVSPRPANLPENEATASDDFLVVGARLSPENVRLIDLARVTAGYGNRSEFIAAALVEKAKEILAR